MYAETLVLLVGGLAGLVAGLVDKDTCNGVLWALGLAAAPFGGVLLFFLLFMPGPVGALLVWPGWGLSLLWRLGAGAIGLLAGLYLLVRQAVRCASAILVRPHCSNVASAKLPRQHHPQAPAFCTCTC
jgi:hypothetical protein